MESNLKGTGFEFDLKRMLRFRESLPSNIGDIINIRVPQWLQGDAACIKAKVVQCIPKGDKCGLLVELLENVDSDIPLMGGERKGEEIVVPLEWYIP